MRWIFQPRRKRDEFNCFEKYVKRGMGSMLYLGAVVIILFFAVAGMIGHEITESEKWYKVFKQKGRDE